MAVSCFRLLAASSVLVWHCGAWAAGKPQVFTSLFADATVFRDRIRNGVLDQGEKQTKTLADGRFSVPKGKGRLLLIGGIEIATGKANTRILTVPAKARAASTLSALWQSLLDRGSNPARNARLLKLPANASIRNFRAVPADSAASGSKAEFLLRRDAELDVLVSFSKSLSGVRLGFAASLAGRFAGYQAFPEDADIGALADALLGLKRRAVNLNDTATVRALLSGIYQRLAVSVPEENLAIIADAAASMIRQMELPAAPLDKIRRIRANAAAVISARDYALLNARYTGYALEQQVQGEVYDPGAQTIPPPAEAPVFTPALNDTGVTGCSDGSSNNLVCPVAGFPGQDAEYGRDVTANDDRDGHAGFSYTKIAADGAALPPDAGTWSCVRDNVTGLVWEVKTNDGGLRDVDNGYTFYSADYDPNARRGTAGDADGFAAAVNAQGFCGAGDWRLPTVDELESLVDAGVGAPGPTLDARFLGATRTDYGYWTSSAYAPAVTAAWIVRFDDGSVSTEIRDNGLAPVRLVRGAP